LKQLVDSNKLNTRQDLLHSLAIVGLTKQDAIGLKSSDSMFTPKICDYYPESVFDSEQRVTEGYLYL